MLDNALVDTLERLTPSEQKAILAVAEYIERQRNAGSSETAESPLAELQEPRFTTPGEALSQPAKPHAASCAKTPPSCGS